MFTMVVHVQTSVQHAMRQTPIRYTKLNKLQRQLCIKLLVLRTLHFVVQITASEMLED